MTRNRLRKNSKKKSSYASNKIEGNPLTENQAYEVYKEYCDKKKIKALYIKDANHSLEVEGQPYESIDVLKNIMQFIER